MFHILINGVVEKVVPPDPSGLRPPHLPRPEVLLAEGATRFRRDHLHDRNREHAVYDPANPGLATYVRVSRRRCDPFVEQQIAATRARVRDGEIEKERVESRLANDLLESRSQSLRKAMADKSPLNSMVAAKQWGGKGKPSTAPAGSHQDPISQRCHELERRLLIMQRMSGCKCRPPLLPAVTRKRLFHSAGWEETNKKLTNKI